MPLADFSNANNWLDEVKLAFPNAEDAEEESASADAIIRGALADVFPDNINLWTNETPLVPPQEAVPELIREVAAMLMAAFFYQKKYSEESNRSFNYGVQLEQRAMRILKGLRDGTIVLGDIDIINSLGLLEADYLPNDTTIVTPEMNDLVGPKQGEPLRFFEMGKVF